ncbi:MAG: response regulator [Lachnospiraceae bacterium]|nr:response regulator [Lachnospiraceae bacterium]
MGLEVYIAKWVIVVDDDTANLNVAGHILSKNNMRVTALKSGQSLVDYVIGNGFPDLILLDVKMPGMDGFETLRILREKEAELRVSSTPVIFVTADEDFETEKRGFEVGVADFVRKPFDPDVLVRRIDNVISQTSTVRSLKSEVLKDSLTGLLSKGATDVAMVEKCSSQTGMLIMADLDSFKPVNDLYGHEKGDEVLISFAKMIRVLFPTESTFGRVGGDEFVIFAKGLKDANELKEIGDKLNTLITKEAQKILDENMSIPIGATLGAVAVPEHGNDFKSLLNLADRALNNAKKNGKHCVEIYGSSSLSEEDSKGLDIYAISEILGERSIPNVALQLDKDAFSYVYRYVMRDIVRNQRSACKILFTLEFEMGRNGEEENELAVNFGNHVSESLRKSDILMRCSFNQFFVFLTDVKPSSTDKVIDHIVNTWKEKNERDINISVEKDVIFADSNKHHSDEEYKVVVVDDDIINLKLAGSILSSNGIHTTAIKSGQALLNYVDNDVPDLILLDVKMPDLDGYETLKILRQKDGNASTTPVIFLTADESEEAESRGLSLGAMDFIKKPFTPEVLALRVKSSLELIRLQKSLSIEVERKTEENRNLFIHVVQSIADAIDAKDAYTNGHSSRVAEYSKEIAKRAGFSNEMQSNIYIAALLHDAGKIGIRDSVINKPGKLTDEEFEEIKSHPTKGAKILENISEMPMLAVGAKCHHERYDGTGYPQGLKGEKIPQVARIIAVADAYDAMSSYRSYRDVLPQSEIVSEINEGIGTQFDPRFAEIMLNMIEEDIDYKMKESYDESKHKKE